MKTNYLKQEDEIRLEEISTEIFEMYVKGKSDEEGIDFYEDLTILWNTIDRMLNNQYLFRRTIKEPK